jgi:hypothetical protein
MGLLKKLFRRGKPAPEVHVHPDDQDLVSEADRRWWSTLTLNDCQVFEEQDNLPKVTSFQYYIDEKGLTEEEAARRVRQSFVTYYATLEERNDEPFAFADQDAKLPYVIKDRVNRYILTLNPGTALQPADVGASSVNALVRILIRKGMI